jgi:methionine-rich copper-binding protein CopC
VGTNIVVLVSFNENVTVSGTPQLTMDTGATDRVVGYYSGSGTSSLTFNYKVLAGDTSSDLDYVSTTALALNGGMIRDGSGNNAILTLPAPGGANSLSASKAIVIDTTTPTLVSTVPSDGATGVAVDANIVLNFSETMSNRMIGSKLYLKKSSDNSTVQEFSIPSFTETGSQITVNPSSDLLHGATYYVTIDAGFGDSALNFFTGFTDSTSLNFTTITADTTAPTLISTTPSDNATGVSDSTTIVLNFAEPVWGVVGKNVYVKKSSDNSIFEVIPADGLDPSSNGIYGNGTTQITVRLSLTPTFEYNTEYYVQIDAGSFEDASGNGFAGISSTTDLSFTIYNPTCAQKLAWGVDCLVGDTGPGGGEVFFTSGLGSSKYMEVGPTTWYDSAARQTFTWCAGKETQAIPGPGTGGSRGIGAANTARIASFCSPNGAAYWITQRNAGGGIGGKTDWFLPTKAELNFLCLYARQLPEDAGTCTNANPLRSGFLNQSYWSSTEHNWKYVWYQNFINGGQAYFDGAKGLSLYVRPVRAFG